MALTRPKLTQFITTVSSIQDPITVLKAGTAQANVDIGFLMNRANGLVSNVALYWNEQGNTFVTAFTSNTGLTDSNITVTSYANIATGAVTVNPTVTVNSVSTTTGALVVTGGVGVSGNIIGGGYHYITPTSMTDLSGGTVSSAIVVPGNGWGLHANIAQGGTAYLRQVLGKDSGNNIVIGHSTPTALNANINIYTGSAGQFNILNTSTQTPIFNVNNTANTVVLANSQTSTSATTGALQVAGGVGIAGNIYTTGNVYGNSRIGFTWSANTTSAVYQVYNAATNSIDTIFG